MGTPYAGRGRLVLTAILGGLMVLAVMVALGALARPAAAQETFAQCSTCHDYSYNDACHNAGLHPSQSCGTCHVNGSGAAGLVPSACVSCHGTAAQIIADTATSHGSAGCGTTDGCHGYTTTSPTPSPSPSVTPAKTTMSLKASPTILRVRKTVKFVGTAGPVAALAGAKVAFKVERKVGTKWVKMKTATKTVSTGGKFSWSYRTAKKGAHRVTASIARKSAYTAKKLVRSFKVK